MSKNTNTTKRNYGNERNFGDVIYDPKTKSVFTNIDLGFFGRTTLTLVKRANDGAYDLMKSYRDKNNQEQIICIGKTFPAKKKSGEIIEGMTKGTLGLFKQYDPTTKKTLTNSSDALFITTHKLKDSKPLGDTGLFKVGFITGIFGIEITEESSAQNVDSSNSYEQPEYDDEGDVIPF